MTDHTPYTPSEADDRIARAYAEVVHLGSEGMVSHDEAVEEFYAYLAAHDARVPRDAVQQFIEACRGKLDEPGFLLPSNHWGDIEAAIRVAESYVKNYPEETP